MLAAETGDIAIAQLLAGAGANVDLALEEGETALMLACWRGHAPFIQMILAAGADCEAATSKVGLTPLM